MRAIADCRLYTFVDSAFLRGRTPEAIAKALCDGGSDIIQLRAKGSPTREVLAMAEAILPVTRAAGVPLVINDHPDVARQVGAEFCHLGQEDFFGTGRKNVFDLAEGDVAPGIGLSSHSPEQAARALSAGASYLGVGPVYSTGTKPEAKPVGLEYVRWAVANINVPWFAIGGINLGNLDDVLTTGARGICVVSAILNSADIAGACRQFRDRL